LEEFDDFELISDLSRYKPVPDDWSVMITDVGGSTVAIEAGKYKDANMIGAASISAVLNVTRTDEIPYTFGGDGTTFVVPSGARPRVREALMSTRNFAHDGFCLNLRVGAAPLADLRKDGVDVLVAKYCLSLGNHLAMLAAGGVSVADKLIKSDDGSLGYLFFDELTDQEPDLEGLSCRWEPLMTQRGVILSILVKVVDEYDEDLTHRYREVLARLGEVFGADPNGYRPVKVENMVFRWPPKGLKAEALATKGEQSYWRRLLWLYWNSFIQFLLEKFDLSGGGYDAPVYRQELRENSDYRRFDDTLRMVLDCTTEEVRAIDGVLSYFRSQKKLCTDSTNRTAR
jgi:hypothetical protein